ncbi:hypothetical protein ABZV87_05750 [Streptomyces tendae]|uniref:hypothetical protein n=2 Tax=Streptomyces tendae TaxID=1932 RepID=UPI0033A3ACA0
MREDRDAIGGLMRTAVLRQIARIEIEEYAVPRPDDGEVLVLKGGQAGPVDLADRVAGRTGATADLTDHPREPGT